MDETRPICGIWTVAGLFSAVTGFDTPTHGCKPLSTAQILEETGIILVPGSGFGQEDGTYHFRTTFLPAEDTMQETMERLVEAHTRFMDEHRD